MHREFYTNIAETNKFENVPFADKWQVFSKIDDNLYVLCKKDNRKTMYTPMFIHSIKYIIGRDYNECDKFNLEITNPGDIDDIKEKLRYFRLKNSLSQEDVAEYIGVDRTTYMSYENETRIYPIDIMHKMAKMYFLRFKCFENNYLFDFADSR